MPDTDSHFIGTKIRQLYYFRKKKSGGGIIRLQSASLIVEGTSISERQDSVGIGHSFNYLAWESIDVTQRHRVNPAHIGRR